MKKILIIGIVAIFLGVALFTGVNSLQDKQISSNEFSVGSAKDYINITDSTLTVKDRGGKIFNNDANIFVYNNATYDTISFDIKASEYDGLYPERLAVDLGDNGRDEYRFDGWSVGQMGNQSNMIDEYWTSSKSFDAFPSPDGDTYLVKLPSRADVKNVNLDIDHPLIPVVQEGYFESDNSDLSNSNWYYYKYDYSWGYSYMYGYSYYYPSSYFENYQYASTLRYSYPANKYSSGGNTYDRGQPDARVYLKWDLDDPDFSVPFGANIIQYELNYPVRNYHGYAGRYGYDWTSNSANYYAGEKTFGVFEATEPQLTDDDMNTYYSYYDYYYNYERFNDLDQSTLDDAYYDLVPDYDSTVIDDFTLDEHFGNSYYQDVFTPVYDLSDLAQAWMDGLKDNNGIMLAMYDTPYDSMPYDDGTKFVYYNDAGNYAGARSKNNYQFYYGGYLYNPYNTYYYNNYGHLYPKLIITYDLVSLNPWVDFGDDGIVEYQHEGELDEKVSLGGTSAYNFAINNYLANHLPDEVDDYGNEFTYVPIRIGADSAGKVVMDNLRIEYDYTHRIHYNPSTGNLVNELNSLVPSSEDGWSLLPINITARTKGNITIDNLELSGTMPNYRPAVSEIVAPPVPEGTVDDEWLDLTRFFYDIDQDASTLEYRVQRNTGAGHVDFFINRPSTRGDPVYLGIDASVDENWFGEVEVVVSATDDHGKDIWSDPFTVIIESVNDEPYMVVDLPEISGEEGVDPILIEYTAPTGRGVATGKISFLMAEDGKPYFEDIEGDRIHLGFQLLDSDMNETMIETSNDDGFKIYRGEDGEISLYVLPPEYTEDPDNYIIVIGSNPDYNYNWGLYYLRVFMSDDPLDIYGQSFETVEIMIEPVNDPPIIFSIPDVVMDEDSSYSGSIDFIDEYLDDIDSSVEDLSVTFESSASEVDVYLDGNNHLQVDVEMDFNGVVPVTVRASDGHDETLSMFNVRIRSINDLPKVVVRNLFNDKIIDDMFYIRGTANDIEKDLRWIEVGVVKEDGFLYEDDWDLADGTYVWQYLLDIRNLETGRYDVFIRAYDGMDYSPTLEYRINVKTPEPGLPSPAPVVTIITEFNDVLEDKVTVEGTAVDESGYVEFVEFRVDGGLWKKVSLDGEMWTSVLNTRVLTNTVHNLSVRAYDGKSYSSVVHKEFEVMNYDSDLDGISNEMENILQLDPFNPLDGVMDFDGDGFSNAEEVAAGTNIFDGNSYPDKGDDEFFLDVWALIFISVAIVSAIVILGLFILNIRIEKNMHQWREDLHRMRSSRRPKTLLQKIVELTSVYGGSAMHPAGPSLPGGQTEAGGESAALPPAQDMEQQQNI